MFYYCSASAGMFYVVQRSARNISTNINITRVCITCCLFFCITIRSIILIIILSPHHPHPLHLHLVCACVCVRVRVYVCLGSVCVHLSLSLCSIISHIGVNCQRRYLPSRHCVCRETRHCTHCTHYKIVQIVRIT